MKQKTNPLLLLAGKSSLTSDEQTWFQLVFWLPLDRVLDGDGEDRHIKQVTRMLVCVQIAASEFGDRALYDRLCALLTKWLAALELAHGRRCKVAVSTDLRKGLLAAAAAWANVLRRVNIGLLNGIMLRWEEIAEHFGVNENDPVPDLQHGAGHVRKPQRLPLSYLRQRAPLQAKNRQRRAGAVRQAQVLRN